MSNGRRRCLGGEPFSVHAHKDLPQLITDRLLRPKTSISSPPLGRMPHRERIRLRFFTLLNSF